MDAGYLCLYVLFGYYSIYAMIFTCVSGTIEVE